MRKSELWGSIVLFLETIHAWGLDGLLPLAESKEAERGPEP